MANRFDVNRPQNFQYTSQYVPLPLHEISNMAQKYSDRYHKGKAIPSQLDLLASKIQAAPMDYALKDKYLKSVHAELDPLVQSAKPEDWANPQFQDRLNQTIMKHASDPVLNTIASNKKWYDDEYTKYKSDPKNSKDLDFTLEMDKSDPYDTGFKQNTEGKAYSGINNTVYKESYDDTAKIMSNIPASGGKSGVWDFTKTRTINNGETEVYNKSTNSWDAVTDADIKRVAQASTPLFGRTDSGLYRIRKALAPIYGAQVQNLDYDTLHQMAESDYSGESMKRFNEVNDMLYDDLARTGFKQIFHKKSYDQDITKEDNRAAIEANKNARSQGLVQSLETGNTLDFTSPEYKELKGSGMVDDKGQIDFKKLSNQIAGAGPGNKEAGDRIANTGGWLNLDLSNASASVKDNYNKVVKIGKQAINTIGKDKVEEALGKPISELKGEDVNKLLNMYNDFTKVRGYNGNMLEGVEQKSLQTEVLTHPNNYELLDSDLQIGTKGTEEFKKNLHNNDFDFNVTNRVNINGKSYLTGTLTDKANGETKEVFLRPKTAEYNSHFDNAAIVSRDINKAYASGNISRKSDDPRFEGNLLSESKTDNGTTLTRVYKTNEGKEVVVRYDIKKQPSEVKGKMQSVLTNATILGNNFKEYQQGLHLSYGSTGEGRKMYENEMNKKDAVEENVK